jgi:16S rRNA (cytidine1402-2'-O)-methyltransferase
MTDATKGVLYIVATPIGNLEDITHRAIRILREVDFIVAEDTRHSKKLLNHYDIPTPYASSYYQGVERERSVELLKLLQAGMSLALISDAGTPLLNDPGFPLVRIARENGIDVIPIPGPTAMMAALVKSGLPPDHFIFDGTPPKKLKAREDYFESLKTETRTVIVYESPHRLLKTLETIQQILPTRIVSLCRELTKLHEEAIEGTATELIHVLYQRPSVKGECVLLISGQRDTDVDATWSDLSLADHVQQCITEGRDRKAAMKAVAKLRGVPKREVFEAVEDSKRP